MASVTSLDKDMKNIRLSKYTPQASNEVIKWIESALGERLQPGDLLQVLKDGTVLCKLMNLVAPGSVRYKESSMPFVQMENISHFLRASQSPPLSLQSHDLFQTVDLYEAKDPAQVLQCIAAFSRRAHAIQPSKFRSALGEKARGGVVSPQSTGGFSAASPQYGRPRNASDLSETTSTTSSKPSQAIGGRGSPFRPSATAGSPTSDTASKSSAGGVSSWSKKTDEGKTAPAWNIHQYGYMGGASQGNQGISFGARRQITSTAPKVPSLAEKERKRREQEAEAERLHKEEEALQLRRRKEREAEEERARIHEEQRWEEETRRQRDHERQRIEAEKRRWEEEERRWKAEEENRVKEEQEAESRLANERQRKKAQEDVRLTGQFLSQYQAEKKRQPSMENSERARIQELERQLEEAKAREAQYERERQERLRGDQNRERSQSRPVIQDTRNQSRSKSRTRSVPSLPVHDSEDTGQEAERDYLQNQWQQNQAQPEEAAPPKPPRPLPTPQAAVEEPPIEPTPPLQPPRPLPTPQSSVPSANPEPTKTPSPPPPSLPTRPLPNPANYLSSSSPTRKSPFARPQATHSPPITTSSQSPASNTPSNPLRKPPFAKPSSLLSREMELDRQRQQEWEEAQKATQAAAASGVSSGNSAAPGGGAWDTSQYGYLGGDSQNRGGAGINMGAARRQLVGPRDPPNKGSGGAS